MMKCYKVLFFLAVATCCSLLASCGGGSTGGGAGEFKTVYLTAATDTARIESDILTGDDCSTNPPTGGTFVTDNATVVISSNLYPNSTTPGLSVGVDSATISYKPANSNTPAIPPDYITSIGTIVAPGGKVTISVPVAKDLLKYMLVVNKGFQLCSASYFEYTVTISFDCVELGNDGKRTTVTTSLNVAIADRTS